MLQSGQAIEFHSFPTVSKEHLKEYADASGDYNPIHQDEEVAKKAGLPGVIAHGMYIAGLIAERARLFIEGEQRLEIQSFQTRFRAMTLVGDTPSVGGMVKEASDEGISLELQARNQRGEVTTVSHIRYKILK